MYELENCILSHDIVLYKVWKVLSSEEYCKTWTTQKLKACTLKRVTAFDLCISTGQVLCHGMNFKLMTSHLESLANHSEERQRQLKTAFTKMVEVDQNTVSIFGGDTNTRDHEVLFSVLFDSPTVCAPLVSSLVGRFNITLRNLSLPVW